MIRTIESAKVREWALSVLGVAIIIQQVWFEKSPDTAIILIGAGLAGAVPAGVVNKRLSDDGRGNGGPA